MMDSWVAFDIDSYHNTIIIAMCRYAFSQHNVYNTSYKFKLDTGKTKNFIVVISWVSKIIYIILGICFVALKLKFLPISHAVITDIIVIGWSSTFSKTTSSCYKWGRCLISFLHAWKVMFLLVVVRKRLSV